LLIAVGRSKDRRSTIEGLTIEGLTIEGLTIANRQSVDRRSPIDIPPIRNRQSASGNE